MQRVLTQQDEGRAGGEEVRGGSVVKNGATGGDKVEKESMMMELTRLVQNLVKESSWWERRGVDCSILAAAFLCLPLGKKQLPPAVSPDGEPDSVPHATRS